MRLALGLGVLLGHIQTFEGQGVAGIGVGEDRFDRADGLLGQPVNGHGAGNTVVPDMVGYDPAKTAAIGGPDYRALRFF